jgi:hypothetical protein
MNMEISRRAAIMDEKFESSSNNYNELNLNRPDTETDLRS